MPRTVACSPCFRATKKVTCDPAGHRLHVQARHRGDDGGVDATAGLHRPFQVGFVNLSQLGEPAIGQEPNRLGGAGGDPGRHVAHERPDTAAARIKRCRVWEAARLKNAELPPLVAPPPSTSRMKWDAKRSALSMSVTTDSGSTTRSAARTQCAAGPARRRRRPRRAGPRSASTGRVSWRWRPRHRGLRGCLAPRSPRSCSTGVP